MIKLYDRPDRHRFTATYAQPDDYHYCLDSIILPMFVADEMKDVEIGSEFRALDVCAGCGIVGLELGHYLPTLQHLDFLEIQTAFQSYFEKNLAIVGFEARDYRFLEVNYEALSTAEFAGRYNLIVGNPPYFLPNEGLPSKSEIRNRCRFFRDASFEDLFLGAAHALKPGGRAFLLVKEGSKHGRRAFENVRVRLEGIASVSVVADIRGTHVVRLDRLSSTVKRSAPNRHDLPEREVQS